VFLPGYNGIPVRGAGNNVISPDELKTYRPTMHMHFRIFDLKAKEDLEAYEKLMTAAASNLWIKVVNEIIPTDIGTSASGYKWSIGVKWSELYLQPPMRGKFIATENALE